jgi:CBS domain-containing protein
MVKVREIMKKYVITVDPDVSISNVAKIMTNNRIGSVIIMKGQKPIGIVTDDDIVGIIANGMDPKKIKIKDIKSTKRFVTTSPDDDMLKVAKKMLKSGIKRVPVVMNGKLLGIVSDKEILTVSPELIHVLSERLKAQISAVAAPDKEISGICERCGAYSDELRNIASRWVCENCRDED